MLSKEPGTKEVRAAKGKQLYGSTVKNASDEEIMQWLLPRIKKAKPSEYYDLKSQLMSEFSISDIAAYSFFKKAEKQLEGIRPNAVEEYTVVDEKGVPMTQAIDKATAEKRKTELEKKNPNEKFKIEKVDPLPK